MDYTICDAAAAHLPQLAALERACFAAPWTRAQLAGQLPDDRHVFLIAAAGETVLGYANFLHVLDEGDIGNVAVAPEHRRQGIADALLDALCARAAALVPQARVSDRRSAPKLLSEAGRGRAPHDLVPERGRDDMIILAIESSCDETAVALVRDGREVLTDQVFSQADLHAIYGGVVPEIASRSHVEVISQLADRALAVTGLTRGDIDAVAVTCAPGLIGALLVGVNFAKSAALALGVPLIPVHHVRGHIAANYIAYPELKPPFVCLAISGGNTLICDVRDYTDLRILGATRDDAAGECFDKTARVLGLPYPGGKPIDDLSKTGDDRKYKLPIGHVDGCPYDMSFSGLKTAVINLAHTAEQKGEPLDKPSLAASFCRAMSESLVPRTMAAVRELGYDKLAVAGGVAANSRIRGDFQAACDAAGIRLFVPPLKLCGDNAAMIGCQAYYEYLRGARAGSELNAWANMEISEVPFYGRA